eukprot:TRINITY_DN11121_c0_g1_i2.p1 TRINITY_DN11121_c0_g1~~TRINITY_DN11121_c0_g1_i2.p1  ORF type:complete len:140 (+),score=9.89 TRINITY_DN11121_c0_g1_i2:806-1225(+)
MGDGPIRTVLTIILWTHPNRWILSLIQRSSHTVYIEWRETKMKPKNRHRSNRKKQRFSPLPSPSHLSPSKPRGFLYHSSFPVPAAISFSPNPRLLKSENPQIFPPVKDKLIADLDSLLRPGFFWSPALFLRLRRGFLPQ